MKFDKLAIVGLGNMGKAMTEQFSRKGHEVHAWNRSEGKRKDIDALNLPGVIVYSDLAKCIDDVSLIIMNVLGDEDLKTANAVLQSIPAASWADKTIVQFTSQDALGVTAQEKIVTSMGGKLVGGAMLAAPADIGTDHAMFLMSANADAVPRMEAAKPIISELGSVTTFTGDVGYAALVDFGMIETLFFGLAGHEMCFKLLQKYGASMEVQNAYAQLTETTTLAVAKGVFAEVSKAFLNGNDWETLGKTFNAGTMVATVNMHTRFIEKMGLVRTNFMTTYLESLNKVANMEHGSSQVTDVYEEDGKKEKEM